MPQTTTHDHRALWRRIAVCAAIAGAYMVLAGGSDPLNLRPDYASKLGLGCYPPDSFARVFVTGFVIFGLGCLVLTVQVVTHYGRWSNRARLHAWLLWAFVPPLWFLLENQVVLPLWGEPEANFDAFKHSQDTGAKLWAAGVTVFTAVMTKETIMDRVLPALRGTDASPPNE